MFVCPKCGIKSSESNFIGPFCEKCYELKVVKPKFLKIRTCKRCLKYWDGKEWSVYNQRKIEENIASKFKGNFERVDYYLESGTAVIYFKVEGKIYMAHRTFFPETEEVICSECSKKSGGYFEAILQLRGDKIRVGSASKKLSKELSRKTFVGKVEEKKEGIDLYVGSTKKVFEVLKYFNYSYKISRKLFTQKQGKRLYRTTFVIRF
ncbi:MAG: NMD3-related protein [Candidatus Micrarchaeia archaeon]